MDSFADHECLDEDIDHVEDGQQGTEQADEGGKAERGGGVGGQTVDGQVGQAAEVEGRLACRALLLVVTDFLFLEANPHVHALGVALRLAKLP